MIVNYVSPTLVIADPAPKSLTSSSAQEASKYTVEINKKISQQYDLMNKQDFNDANKGLIAQLPDPLIKNVKGDTVWNGKQFSFIQGDSPATVNPSLWRQEKLNNIAGLFKVTEGIWQIRGYDIANMTLGAGKTGWIVIDPLLSSEVSRATFDFAMQQLGRKPVVAVIYTHSHIDHFGGIRGIVNEADVSSGKVPIIAPEGFMDHAVAENILAGNAMSRRAQYQFGSTIAYSEKEGVGSGLGKGLSLGNAGLIPPTDIIKKTGEEKVIDGIRMVFQMANGSEAPAEFTFYIPQYKALCLSEVVTSNMHNIYTLRGAKMRDALGWSKYINEMIDLFPDADVAFRSHHWPVWGQSRIHQHLANQRDAYRFIHDEAVQLLNQGKKMDDIGNQTYFPQALANDFSTHGYYGTLSHNMRAVYAFYLGYYDGNPATLHRLPLDQTSIRYVEAMGGSKAVMSRVEKAYNKGDYQWAAELNNHLIFADPKNQKAKILQANILEQLGYQAESAVWRNEYLTAAKELRDGVKPSGRSNSQNPDMLRGMNIDMILDFIAVRLDHQKVDGITQNINIYFTDLKENYALELSNGVLNNTKGRVLSNSNATLSISRGNFLKMLLAKIPLTQIIQAGDAKIEGDPKSFSLIFTNLKEFNPAFNIVTPN